MSRGEIGSFYFTTVKEREREREIMVEEIACRLTLPNNELAFGEIEMKKILLCYLSSHSYMMRNVENVGNSLQDKFSEE